jgi:glycosyltransferase involved in cell wall biosynthesis
MENVSRCACDGPPGVSLSAGVSSLFPDPLRFSLSCRDVEELLAERGTLFSSMLLQLLQSIQEVLIVRVVHFARLYYRRWLSMNASKETILAIIPAYCEGRFIGQVVRHVLQYVQAVLVVDDGSPDSTATEAEAAGAKVIRHSKNLGKGAALKTGLYYAVSIEAAFFLFLDGDGQHDPSDIPAFIDAINGSHGDLVVGNRMPNLESMPLLRRWTNQLMSWQIGRICKIPISDSQCGFRLARRELLPVLMAPSNRFEFESESIILAVRLGFRLGFVPIRTIYSDQQSKIRPLGDTMRYLRLIRKYRNASGSPK